MLKRIINDLLNRLAILYHVGTISLAGFAFFGPLQEVACEHFVSGVPSTGFG